MWTTQYQRTQQTAAHLSLPARTEPALGEICAGEHDSLTYEEIAERFPTEFALRDTDKLGYRYPGGESYLDVVARVRPVLDTIVEQDNLLIISHQVSCPHIEKD